jgi:NhaP-type Na+/H+ or K+/H+ antiporter
MEAHGMLTISLALAAGVVANILSHHVRIPGIVLLLGAGVVLGPDALNWVRPEQTGGAVHVLVGLAVAIILFEGGLNLDMRRLRKEGRAIRQLVTVGALVTAVGGTLAARLILAWPWSLSILFGTLVIVTGPTVVTPLLRRLHVEQKVATILEAEGVLIDPIGAIVAVVTLQVLATTTALEAAESMGSFLSRMGLGLGGGFVAGWVLSWLLARRRLIPEARANIFVLGCVVFLYTASDALVAESGILAVTVAGIVVGNRPNPLSRDLREFKEQLTVLLIGLLFVLLAAQVRLRTVADLGWPGLAVVFVLMFVVRPANVLAGTVGVSLSWRQRAFLSWIAPRGIVAAAVASLFAKELQGRGVEGADALQSLVFLTIAVTVTLQGLSGGALASALGLKVTQRRGVICLGASPFGRAVADALRRAGREVFLVDINPNRCKAAEQEGFRVICGNIHTERVQLQSGMDGAAMVVGVTSNSELNILLERDAREEYKVPLRFAALDSLEFRVDVEKLEGSGGRVLFGTLVDVERWDVVVRRKQNGRLTTSLPKGVELTRAGEWGIPDGLLPLVLIRDRTGLPVDLRTKPAAGNKIFWIHDKARDAEVRTWLVEMGWEIVADVWVAEEDAPADLPAGGSAASA